MRSCETVNAMKSPLGLACAVLLGRAGFATIEAHLKT